MSHQKRRRTKGEMFPIIEAWQSSELSKQAFCDQEGIAKSVFYYWWKKYMNTQDPRSFVPIAIGGEQLRSNKSVIEIQYPNGVVLRLPEHTPSSIIRAYLHF